MTTLYKPHEVSTIAAINALALDADKRSNGALVISGGELCPLHLPYATRNERPAEWLLEDGTVQDGDPVTVLVPIEAEEEWTVGTEAPAWSPGTESWAREFQAQMPGRRLFRHLVTPWEEA